MHVFVRNRAPLREFLPSAVGSLVYRHLLYAGIKTRARHYDSHALRYNLVGKLLENRISIPVISEIFGHADSDITLTYLKAEIGQLRDCVLEVAAYED